MRGTFIAMASIAYIGTLASVAHAQTTAPTAPTTTTTTNAPATTTTPVTASTSGAGPSTASLPQATAAVKKKAFRAEAYNLNILPKQAFNNNEGAPTSSNYVGLRYVVGNGKSVSVRQTFSYDFPKAGAEGDGKGKTGDIYLSLTDSKLADFGNDFTMIGVFRAYLPTGEDSRFNKKTNGSLFAWLIAQKAIGKFEMSYNVIPSWFNQAQNGYNKADGTEAANKDYSFSQFADLVYNISDKLSVDQSIGTDNVWYRPITGQNTTREHALSLMSTITYQPIAEIGISAILENSVNIYNSDKPFRLYRDEDLTAYLLISANVGIL